MLRDLTALHNNGDQTVLDDEDVLRIKIHSHPTHNVSRIFPFSQATQKKKNVEAAHKVELFLPSATKEQNQQ